MDVIFAVYGGVCFEILSTCASSSPSFVTCVQISFKSVDIQDKLPPATQFDTHDAYVSYCDTKFQGHLEFISSFSMSYPCESTLKITFSCKLEKFRFLTPEEGEEKR